MEKKNYKTLVQNAKTFVELENIKNDFLNECAKQHDLIAVSQITENIKNFGDAKAIFECITPSLLKVKGGKTLINKYAKVIKENQSLKTLYAYHEGINANKTALEKKNYITEALSISNPINTVEYANGMAKIINVLTEGFALIGAETVLKTVKTNTQTSLVSESMYYLASQKKNLKNLNEYIAHINAVSDNIVENVTPSINVNTTLEDIVSEMKGKISNNTIDEIFTTENKEVTFAENKKVCLEMISQQKMMTTDNDVRLKLHEMESKLKEKRYDFNSYTKDMLYMSELQEVLK